ncbi:MAG: ABC transporter substrate-binding protein [Syntrophales bacterium]|nr:ABC transporter substrate-binding protein [Syntrophales bacterium]
MHPRTISMIPKAIRHIFFPGFGRLLPYFLMLSVIFVLYQPVAADELKSMSFMPHWLPQAQFAGYYVAYEKGFYRKHGIELTILRGGPGFPPADMLSKGRVNVTSMFLSEAIQLRDKKIKLLNIGQIMQRSGFILVARKGSGITKPEDLNHKKVSLWENFRIQPLAFFRKYRIAVTAVNQGATVNLFLRSGVDAASAMWYNEYHAILNSGWNEDELTTFFFDKYGLNFPEDGIYILEETYRKNPALYCSFVRATMEGWEYAFEHEEEALDVVMRYISDAKTGTNRIHQKWMLARMKDLMMPEGAKTPTGILNSIDYNMVARELQKSGMISQIPSYGNFYVNCASDGEH